MIIIHKSLLKVIFNIGLVECNNVVEIEEGKLIQFNLCNGEDIYLGTGRDYEPELRVFKKSSTLNRNLSEVLSKRKPILKVHFKVLKALTLSGFKFSTQDVKTKKTDKGNTVQLKMPSGIYMDLSHGDIFDPTVTKFNTDFTLCKKLSELGIKSFTLNL